MDKFTLILNDIICFIAMACVILLLFVVGVVACVAWAVLMVIIVAACLPVVVFAGIGNLIAGSVQSRGKDNGNEGA